MGSNLSGSLARLSLHKSCMGTCTEIMGDITLDLVMAYPYLFLGYQWLPIVHRVGSGFLSQLTISMDFHFAIVVLPLCSSYLSF